MSLTKRVLDGFGPAGLDQFTESIVIRMDKHAALRLSPPHRHVHSLQTLMGVAAILNAVAVIIGVVGGRR